MSSVYVAPAADMINERPSLPRLSLVVRTRPFSWETAEPGRAARAALLWTQRQASKVHWAHSQDNHKP